MSEHPDRLQALIGSWIELRGRELALLEELRDVLTAMQDANLAMQAVATAIRAGLPVPPSVSAAIRSSSEPDLGVISAPESPELPTLPTVAATLEPPIVPVQEAPAGTDTEEALSSLSGSNHGTEAPATASPVEPASAPAIEPAAALAAEAAAAPAVEPAAAPAVEPTAAPATTLARAVSTQVQVPLVLIGDGPSWVGFPWDRVERVALTDEVPLAAGSRSRYSLGRLLETAAVEEPYALLWAQEGGLSCLSCARIGGVVTTQVALERGVEWVVHLSARGGARPALIPLWEFVAALHNDAGDDVAGNNAKSDHSTHDEVTHDDPIRDQAERDDSLRDETSRDETGRDEVGGDETSRDETSRDETSRDETSRDETSRDESSCVETIRHEATYDESVLDEAARDASDDADADEVEAESESLSPVTPAKANEIASELGSFSPRNFAGEIRFAAWASVDRTNGQGESGANPSDRGAWQLTDDLVTSDKLVPSGETVASHPFDTSSEAGTAHGLDIRGESDPSHELDHADEADPSHGADTSHDADPSHESDTSHDADPSHGAGTSDEADPPHDADTSDEADPSHRLDNSDHPDPLHELGTSADLVTSHEPLTSNGPVISRELDNSPEPAMAFDPINSLEPATAFDPINTPEPATACGPINAPEPAAAREPVNVPEPVTVREPATSRDPFTSRELDSSDDRSDIADLEDLDATILDVGVPGFVGNSVTGVMGRRVRPSTRAMTALLAIHYLPARVSVARTLRADGWSIEEMPQLSSLQLRLEKELPDVVFVELSDMLSDAAMERLRGLAAGKSLQVVAVGSRLRPPTLPPRLGDLPRLHFPFVEEEIRLVLARLRDQG